MKMYIGVKFVQAEPEAKDGVEGYKVVYSEPGKPDYTSWCPADVFERHNRDTAAMPFSMALEALKQGKKIARAGWEDKTLRLWLKSCTDPSGVPVMIMKFDRVDDPFAWATSQPDILADDWYIVE